MASFWVLWCSGVTGNLKKYLRTHFTFSKKVVGAFFTKKRSLLRMGLISLGGAATKV